MYQNKLAYIICKKYKTIFISNITLWFAHTRKHMNKSIKNVAYKIYDVTKLAQIEDFYADKYSIIV